MFKIKAKRDEFKEKADELYSDRGWTGNHPKYIKTID